MKTAEVILADHVINIRLSEDSEIEEIVLREWAIACMKEYAREVLQDYDNWKAHKTPDLVKQYIKERGI